MWDMSCRVGNGGAGESAFLFDFPKGSVPGVGAAEEEGRASPNPRAPPPPIPGPHTPTPDSEPHLSSLLSQSWSLVKEARGLKPRARLAPTEERALHYPPAQLSVAIDRPWPERPPIDGQHVIYWILS